MSIVRFHHCNHGNI